MASGTVLELWRYPVKSMAGERLRATQVDPGGLPGDRAHALMYEHKGEVKRLTARQAPAMLAWRATYPANPDASLDGDPPPARLTGPDGRAHTWADPVLRTALCEDLGKDVDFRREPGGALHDLPRSILVTLEASRVSLEQELGREIDLRRFRTNVHLDMDAEPWAEQDWEGGTLEFASGVRLQLLHPCERCVIPTIDPDTREKAPQVLRHLARAHATGFGINARVIGAGHLEVGDGVALRAPR